MSNRDGFQMETHRSRSNNKPRPCVSVIGGGTVLVVYPDDETAEIMRSEKWKFVNVGFKEFEEIIFVKSNSGIVVRDYGTERLNIHVTVKHRGIATAKFNSPPCPVRRDGDAFIFGIADQVSIDPSKSTEEDEPSDRITEMFEEIIAKLNELKIRRVV